MDDRNDFSPHSGPSVLLHGLDPLSIAYVSQVLQNNGNKSIAALYRLFKSIYVTSRSCTPDAHRIPPVQHEHTSESRRGRLLPTFLFLFLAGCSAQPSFCRIDLHQFFKLKNNFVSQILFFTSFYKFFFYIFFSTKNYLQMQILVYILLLIYPRFRIF